MRRFYSPHFVGILILLSMFILPAKANTLHLFSFQLNPTFTFTKDC